MKYQSVGRDGGQMRIDKPNPFVEGCAIAAVIGTFLLLMAQASAEGNATLARKISVEGTVKTPSQITEADLRASGSRIADIAHDRTR